jgi:hypothetical protein
LKLTVATSTKFEFSEVEVHRKSSFFQQEM